MLSAASLHWFWEIDHGERGVAARLSGHSAIISLKWVSYLRELCDKALWGYWGDVAACCVRLLAVGVWGRDSAVNAGCGSAESWIRVQGSVDVWWCGSNQFVEAGCVLSSTAFSYRAG